jgi:hypothetical protein
MAYSTNLALYNRTKVSVVLLYMDYCANTYGSILRGTKSLGSVMVGDGGATEEIYLPTDCTASALPKCYNTYATCKDKTNFTLSEKIYAFSSIPFDSVLNSIRETDASNIRITDDGAVRLASIDWDNITVYPYISEIDYIPTEIATNLTVKARVYAKMLDDEGTDTDIDPYILSRSSVKGSFWKKFVARNPNYKGRKLEIYEGFLGDAISDYQQKFVGTIKNITIDTSGVKLECDDTLYALEEITIPQKIDCKIVADLTATSSPITLDAIDDNLDTDEGYVKIEDEIIYYSGVNTTTHQIGTTSMTRGMFGTTAAVHSKDEKVTKVRYYTGNPIDILKNDMLTEDADISSVYIDSSAFSAAKTYPSTDINYTGVITEDSEATLNDLVFEIADLLDCKIWVAEDLKITIKRNLPNEPDRVYGTITDDANVIIKSDGVDLNEESRKTRMVVYWNKSALGAADEPDSYGRQTISINADAETEYGDVQQMDVFCRWVSTQFLQLETAEQYIKNQSARRLLRMHDAQPILKYNLEIKDSELKTGDFIKHSVDTLLDVNGDPLDNVIFQLIKREDKGTLINIWAIRLSKYPFCFIAPDATPAYDSATDADKEYGFITENDGTINDGPGYYIY